MELNSVITIIKLLKEIECEAAVDEKELSEIIIDYFDIPFFRVENRERSLIDYIGIETRKVCTYIYRVEKVLDNSLLGEISVGDYILTTEKSKKLSRCNGSRMEATIYVLKLQGDNPRLLTKEIVINLRDNEIFYKNSEKYEYIRIDSFSKYDDIRIQAEKDLLIDLRFNSGGPLSDMCNTYEKFFGSKIKINNQKDGSISFKTDKKGRKCNCYIIVDQITCSSAEIFTGLAYYSKNATIIGRKMYGKNMVCRKIRVNDLIIYVPDKYYYVEGKNIKDIEPDLYVDNIYEYEADGIIKLYQTLRRSGNERL